MSQQAIRRAKIEKAVFLFEKQPFYIQ